MRDLKGRISSRAMRRLDTHRETSPRRWNGASRRTDPQREGRLQLRQRVALPADGGWRHHDRPGRGMSLAWNSKDLGRNCRTGGGSSFRLRAPPRRRSASRPPSTRWSPRSPVRGPRAGGRAPCRGGRAAPRGVPRVPRRRQGIGGGASTRGARRRSGDGIRRGNALRRPRAPCPRGLCARHDLPWKGARAPRRDGPRDARGVAVTRYALDTDVIISLERVDAGTRLDTRGRYP